MKRFDARDAMRPRERRESGEQDLFRIGGAFGMEEQTHPQQEGDDEGQDRKPAGDLADPVFAHPQAEKAIDDGSQKREERNQNCQIDHVGRLTTSSG